MQDTISMEDAFSFTEEDFSESPLDAANDAAVEVTKALEADEKAADDDDTDDVVVDDTKVTEKKDDDDDDEGENSEEDGEEDDSEDDDSEEDLEDEDDDDDSSDVLDDSKDVEEGSKEKEPEEPTRFTVNVDGEEKEVEQEELIRGYQTATSAHARYQEAAQLRTEAEAVTNAIWDNPGDACVAMVARRLTNGDTWKAREIVKDTFITWMTPEIEEGLIEDPKDMEISRMKRREAHREQTEDNQRTTQQHEATAVADQEFITAIQMSITDALKSNSLPSTDAVWDRAGRLLDDYQKGGTPSDRLVELIPHAIKVIVEEREVQARKLAKTLPLDELKVLYPELADRLDAEKKKATKKKSKRRKKAPKKTDSKRKAKKARAEFSPFSKPEGEWTSMEDAFKFD